MVDSSSIEVNRRAKRAKTDRLDGDKLLALLLRYHGGERRVWSVLLKRPTRTLTPNVVRVFSLAP